eukprot:TRINITY_DN11482_c0_g1_i1.p1 TRINITY_DN11482_c0_g1~~TRINITY_DN11482_c0_g1_i1.p1  ORF type:complete len:280 (-),score=32.93 TRINITY_DN11482_c0_g1_i1:11-850(-)
MDFEEVKKNGYILIKNFVSLEQCQEMRSVIDKAVKLFYTVDNIKNHSAYISDDNTGRRSWAFALRNPKEDSVLPSVNWCDCDIPLFQETTTRVMELMSLEKGRILFNIQKYWSHSMPVHFHRDGEVFEVDVTSTDNTNNVIRALHPSYVALLTLYNNADGGGTRLKFKDGTSFVVCAQPGELLVFDNTSTVHGVDELIPKDSVPKGEVIRQIIGWRSLDFNCHYLNKRFIYEPFKPVSIGRATELHQHFLNNTWPKMYREMVLMRKIDTNNIEDSTKIL